MLRRFGRKAAGERTRREGGISQFYFNVKFSCRHHSAVNQVAIIHEANCQDKIGFAIGRKATEFHVKFKDGAVGKGYGHAAAKDVHLVHTGNGHKKIEKLRIHAWIKL
jgi:hypothetical protein